MNGNPLIDPVVLRPTGRVVSHHPSRGIEASARGGGPSPLASTRSTGHGRGSSATGGRGRSSRTGRSGRGGGLHGCFPDGGRRSHRRHEIVEGSRGHHLVFVTHGSRVPHGPVTLPTDIRAVGVLQHEPHIVTPDDYPGLDRACHRRPHEQDHLPTLIGFGDPDGGITEQIGYDPFPIVGPGLVGRDLEEAVAVEGDGEVCGAFAHDVLVLPPTPHWRNNSRICGWRTGVRPYSRVQR